jgi:hypothetical protein
MTTIRDRSALGAEPRGLLIHLSGHVYPLGLVAFRAIRGPFREVPVAAYPNCGGRPPPVTPHREAKGCLATLSQVRSEVFCS